MAGRQRNGVTHSKENAMDEILDALQECFSYRGDAHQDKLSFDRERARALLEVGRLEGFDAGWYEGGAEMWSFDADMAAARRRAGLTPK